LYIEVIDALKTKLNTSYQLKRKSYKYKIYILLYYKRLYIGTYNNDFTLESYSSL